MPETEASLKRIQDKLQLLLKQYTVLQQENVKLKKELQDVKKAIREKDEHTALLSLRIEVLKATRGQMTEAEKKSF